MLKKYSKLISELNNDYVFHLQHDNGSEDYTSEKPEPHVVNISSSHSFPHEFEIVVDFRLNERRDPIIMRSIDELRRWINSPHSSI